MITKYEKANKGKLLVAVLALFVVLAGAAVVFSDNGVDATPVTPAKAPFGTPTNMTYAGGVYSVSADVSIDVNSSGMNLGTASEPLDIRFNITNGSVTFTNSGTTTKDVYINYTASSTDKILANGDITVDGKVNLHLEVSADSTFTPVKDSSVHILSNADVTLSDGATLTLTQAPNVYGQSWYNSGEKGVLSIDGTSRLVLDASNGISGVSATLEKNAKMEVINTHPDDAAAVNFKTLDTGDGSSITVEGTETFVKFSGTTTIGGTFVADSTRVIVPADVTVTVKSTGTLSAATYESQGTITNSGGSLNGEFVATTFKDAMDQLKTQNEVTLSSTTGTIEVPAEGVVIESTKTLNIVGSTVVVAGAADGVSLQTTATPNVITVDGILNIDDSYIYAGVKVTDNGELNVTNAHNLTSTGTVNTDMYVGVGDTLTLSGTIPAGKSVYVYGTLVTNDVIVAGTVNAYVGSTVTINGTVTVNGSFNMYDADMELSGTITVRNDNNGGAAFNVNGTSEVTVLADGTFNVNRATGNSAAPNALTIASGAKFVVEGTLNVTGTLDGKVQDKGTVTFNGTVTGADSGFVVYDGVTLEITSVTGTMTISDNADVVYDYAGMTQAEFQKVYGNNAISAGNEVTVNNVRGVSVAVTVTDAMYDPSSGTTKVRIYNTEMTVSGTVSKATSAQYGSITIGGQTAITGVAVKDDTVFAKMAVGDMSVGRNVNVTFRQAVDITGTFNANISASSNDGGIVLTNSATALTVSGTMILGEGVTGFSTTNLNAVYYTITTTGEGTAVTQYYTNFANAIAAIGDADDDMVLVYGSVKVSADAEIADGMTVQTQSGAALTIDSEVTLTVADGGVLDITSGNSNNKAVNVYGVLVITNNGTGLVGAATAMEYDVLKNVGSTDTYSSLAYALSQAQPGETVTLSKNVTLRSNTTIPEGVTLQTGRYTVIIADDVTLTVNGTFAVQNGGDVTLSTADSKIVVNGVMSIVGTTASDAYSEYKIAGAYYTQRNVLYITTVANAAENIGNEQAISIYGNVSAGDVTFTGGNSGLEVTVMNGAVLTAGTITLDGADFIVASGGTMTGTVAGAANGSTASVQLDRYVGSGQTSLTISSDSETTADGAVDYLFIGGIINSGTVTIASGTVTVMDVSNNTNDLVINSAVEANNGTRTGVLSVASGATLTVGDGEKLVIRTNADQSKVALSVDGTLNIDGTTEITGTITVSGTVDIDVDGTLNVVASNSVVGKVTVTGTVNVAVEDNNNGEFIVDNGAYVALDGTITGVVDIVSNSFIKVYPGANIADAKIEWNTSSEESDADTTEFYINGDLYMTAYGANGSTATIKSVLDSETFDMPGYDVGYRTATSATGLYSVNNWYTTADMITGTNVGTTDIADNDAVYATADVSTLTGTVSAGTGLVIYIDNVAQVNGSSVPVSYGTHTVSIEVKSGYDASNAAITFNGQTVQNGGTITVTEDGFTLTATGATPIDYSQAGSSDGGLGIVEILLVILVVVVVILAIIVVLRMMRS